MSDDPQDNSSYTGLLRHVPFPANVFCLFGIGVVLLGIAKENLAIGLAGAAVFLIGTSWFFWATSFAGAVFYGSEASGWWETRDKAKIFWGIVFLVLAFGCAAAAVIVFRTPPPR